MSFDDHGVTSGKRGSCVATRDRESQWKIAGAKNGNRSERPEHGANIWLGQRLSRRIGGIQTRSHPGTIFNHLRKQAKLIAGAGELTLQTGLRQRRLLVGPFHDIRGVDLYFAGDSPQQAAPLLTRKIAKGWKRFPGQLGRGIDIGVRRRIVLCLQRQPRGWIDCRKCSCPTTFTKSDQGYACEFHLSLLLSIFTNTASDEG